jgi:hypothetical protein
LAYRINLLRVKLKRCRKRAVIAGRTGRTGPSLRVRTTQSERHGGCTADEIAPVTRRHGCGVPSARRRRPAAVDDCPFAAGIWLPVKRPARRDHPTVAPSKCHWPQCRHRSNTTIRAGMGPPPGSQYAQTPAKLMCSPLVTATAPASQVTMNYARSCELELCRRT